MVGLADIHTNPIVGAFITRGNEHLEVMGYTDHGYLHIGMVSRLSQVILSELGYSARIVELAGMAGYMHDLGNVVNRNGHSQSGALIAMEILKRLEMKPDEISIICAAIGNHDEGSGLPVNAVAAALILADKSHVHRNRVRNLDVATFDIHDRVNYAVENSVLNVDGQNKIITMQLTIDINICPVMEYFEIFLSRMIMCRRAANFLSCEFALIINNSRLL